jgi:hypothetical protein
VGLCIVVLATTGRAQNDLNHYFGNLHSHTSYSDGSGSPDDAYKFARDRGKLDFIAITEHNHEDAERGAGDRADGVLIATDHSLYQDVIRAAEDFNEDGKFVTLWGQEFSAISSGNHSNVFQITRVIELENGDYRGLLEDVLDNEVIQFNHPWDSKKTGDYGRKSYSSNAAHRDAVEKHACTIEVINGPGTKDVVGATPGFKGERFYKYYLTRGYRLAPSADQDNHYLNWGTSTDARTVVLAPELTRTSLLAAIRARRVYASTDKNLKLHFAINGHGMGSEFQASSRDLTLKYSVEDPNEPNAKYAFTAVYGSPKVSDSVRTEKLEADTGDQEQTASLTTPFGSTFVYLKVVQTSGTKRDNILSAPVWVNVP